MRVCSDAALARGTGEESVGRTPGLCLVGVVALPQAVLVVVDAATALAPLKNTGCAHLRKRGVESGSETKIGGWRDGIAVSCG